VLETALRLLSTRRACRKTSTGGHFMRHGSWAQSQKLSTPEESQHRVRVVLETTLCLLSTRRACRKTSTAGGKTARKVNNVPAAAVCGSTKVDPLLVSPCPGLVCGITLNTISTATHAYRFVTPPFYNCAGIGVCGPRWWGPPPLGSLLHAQSSSKPLPLVFGLALWHHQWGPA